MSKKKKKKNTIHREKMAIIGHFINLKICFSKRSFDDYIAKYWWIGTSLNDGSNWDISGFLGYSMAILWLFYDYSMAILWLFYCYSTLKFSRLYCEILVDWH